MKTSTRFRLYKTLGYITPPPQEVVFSLQNTPPRRLLFLFPLHKQRLVESRYIARRLQKHLQHNTIDLAISNAHRDLISCPLHAAFYFPVHPDDPTRIQMDVLLARFRGQPFDAVINLEPELNLQLARVMSAVRTSRRIGFTGPYADELYNIQIQADPNGRLHKAYEQMLQVCDLGPPR